MNLRTSMQDINIIRQNNCKCDTIKVFAEYYTFESIMLTMLKLLVESVTTQTTQQNGKSNNTTS